MKVFAGNSNRQLAEAICNYLNVPLGKASVRRFADQEIFVEIQENVRGEDVFLVQPTAFPANDHLMELLIMSLKRFTAANSSPPSRATSFSSRRIPFKRAANVLNTKSPAT